MAFLPVDTAIQVTVGPLVDDTDFKTLETGVAHDASGMSVDLIEKGVNVSTKTDITPTTGDVNDWVELGNGMYSLEITAAQNNTEGTLQIVGVVTGILPFISPIYSVVPVLVYNSLVVGSDNLQVDVTQWLGTAAATPTTAGVPEVDVTYWRAGLIPAQSTTGVPEVDVTHFVAQLAPAPAATGVPDVNATLILDVAPTLTNNDIDVNVAGMAANTLTASALATDAVAEIADQVWDEDATGHQTGGTFGQAIGDPASNTETMYDAVVTDAAGTNIAADIIVIEAQTDDIGTAGAGLTDLGGMSTTMKAQINTEVDGALNTAIPGSPTSNSVNQRLVAIDVLTEASGSGDLAAILIDTAEIGTAGAGLTAINLPNQTMDIVGNITGNLSGSVGSVTAEVTADITKISGDATAADNLELQYDTTGYTDDTAPASRSQVDNIGSASGGSLNFANNLDNIDAAIKSITFEGVETSGTNASIDAEDGTRHVIDDSDNNIDIVYRFDIGGGRTATELTFKGFLNGNNDSATIQAYNGTSFDTLFTLNGKNGSTNDTVSIPLLSKYTGTSTDIGLVFIRIECVGQSNPTLNTDQLLVAAVNIGQSVGHSLGAVWIDTDDGISGTESFVNGVADNPCLTLANAITIGSNVGLHRFVLTPESSITFGETHTNEVWFGESWTLALGGRDVGGSHFTGADVTGTGTGSAEIHFEHCELGAVTLAATHADECDISDTFTCSAADTYIFANCVHTGGTATIDFGSGVGSTTVHIHNFHGAITITNMLIGDVLHFSSSDARLTLASSCTAGTVNMQGNFDFVDNSTGQTHNTLTELAQAAPPANPTITQALMLAYMTLRNKVDVTATVKEVHNNAGTVITKKVLTDDGTVYSEAEMESGP